ncbi:MAG: GNAT family N-acetyltransferase [Methylomonas sp.]|jgi:GNAT superfamily N-acetyltransferase|uniref:GNAT family N-acetyltransferase n=1 Tax=Methylomonas sp. TaxID=418 RepID=UPI00260119DF|nr:GNAT family N-acetyltransferase [Methylomonas sp.]MCK9605606.1 GNAT family N-acetyltransferase [Methylomonas sp.]
MRDSIEISPANEHDISALCELLGILFSQEHEFQANPSIQQRALTEIIADQTIGTIFVARYREKAVGMLSLLYSVSTALGGRVAILEDMVVHPDFRNTGLGARLLGHAKDVAYTTGCRRITLLTDQTNLAAQRFYLRQGFNLSGMLPMRLLLTQDTQTTE